MAYPLPPQEKSLDVLVAEFLASGAPPPPEPVSETLALGDPGGWVAALGQLARRRAWRKLVEIAGTMLVAHRGGGAPGLTAEQVRGKRRGGREGQEERATSCSLRRCHLLIPTYVGIFYFPTIVVLSPLRRRLRIVERSM